ncbi:hypothetical protein [Aliiglaciecola lipolytica]|uniref:hypothetical protein n=1 Tax=Aliiglaciecola lipolytica TaxID=477689 RepID=UPI001C0809E9|nr:hypothetical protein [Aliiglaciecola lipolytica]MBU2877775.1 hypothetical protein [Aliiglaciecola lipolytica]
MNKTILIHIGPPKSGTSAVQKALSNNRDLLLQHGVDYPEHEIGPNGISSGNLTSILDLDQDGKWNVSRSKVSDLLERFKLSEAHTLLLSSEYFFYLTNEIAELIPNAKLIAYIRCPLETFESSYNQSVKRHMRTTPVEFGKNLHLTTLNLLTEAVEKLGRKRFILRAYLSSRDYDLIEDFCSAVNLPSLKSSKSNTNSSYTFDALEFKRWLNQFNLEEIDGAIDQALQAYDGGDKQFSLLPESLFNRYQKQSLDNTRDFVHQYKVVNGKALISFLKNRQSKPYHEQNISRCNVKEICQYFIEHHPQVFDDICERLKHHSSSDIQHVEIITLLLEQQKLKSSFLRRLVSLFG